MNTAIIRHSAMNVLVTGGSGQVGFELKRHLCLLGNIIAPSREELDLADPVSVDEWLRTHRPGLVINAAAYTAVDRAEGEVALASRLNGELPAQLAAYCATHNVPLVHYSSDYVYPGDGEQPWRESSRTGPLNVYGQTKLAGDQAIEASGCRHLIFRTSWVYGARGQNFMKTMLRLGGERQTLSVVADQVGAPTPARLIAQVTCLAIDRHLPSGVYHLAPRGETSWHGFAREIFRLAASQGVGLAVSSARVNAISTADYETPAARPLNSRLCVAKLEAALDLELPSWRPQLALTLQERFLG